MENPLEKKFNFGVVSPGKLYRSSQPDSGFLKYLKAQYGIKTIVVLRTNVDPAEKEFCEANNISLIQLPIKSWRRWPEPDEIQNFFKLLEKPENYPVLIHCHEGKDRTSAITALYRLGCEKWTLKEAVAEMRQWKANWFWQLFIQTSANKIIAGFKEKNTVLLYLKRFLNLIFGLEGLVYALKHEKNLKILLVLEAILFGIAFWRGIGLVEFSVLLLAFGALDALEMFNSSVERLTNLAQPQFDPRVKVVKDLLAGGMIFLGIIVVVLWIIFVFF